MHHRQSRTIGAFLWVIGMVICIVGFGGTWGSAYGQTAGPTPTPGAGAVTLIKSVNPASGTVGDTLTFTIQATNNTNKIVTNVFVEDKFVNFLDIVSVTTTKGTANTNGRDVRVDIGTLNPGESATVTVVTRVRRDASPNSQAVNIASIEFLDPGNTKSTVISSNPVAIGVGAAPPSGLPGTGSNTMIRWPLVVVGALFGIVGMALVRRTRQQAV